MSLDDIDIEGLEDLRQKILDDITEWDPVPNIYDKTFKLHGASVQFGLQVASDIITANIDELINRNNELNEDGTFGYE